MAVVPDDIRAIAPEFTSLTDDTLNAYIADASVLFGTDTYSDTGASNFVNKWGAAHLLALSNQVGGGGGRGPIIRERVGEMERGYAPPIALGTKVSDLATTRYGQVLATYLRRNGVHAAVVG